MTIAALFTGFIIGFLFAFLIMGLLKEMK